MVIYNYKVKQPLKTITEARQTNDVPRILRGPLTFCTYVCAQKLQQGFGQSPECWASININNAIALNWEELLVALTNVLGWLLVGHL